MPDDELDEKEAKCEYTHVYTHVHTHVYTHAYTHVYTCSASDFIIMPTISSTKKKPSVSTSIVRNCTERQEFLICALTTATIMTY